MQNKFSYPLKLEDISTHTKTYNITANADELQEIAQILKVPEIKSFKALINIKLDKPNHLVTLNGNLSSDVVQISVISLEPFTKNYNIDFKRIYDTTITPQEQQEMENLSDINDDVPEAMENKQIDLAAITTEALALELDNFPRKKDEIFSFQPDFDIYEDKPESPFSVLNNLKK